MRVAWVAGLCVVFALAGYVVGRGSASEIDGEPAPPGGRPAQDVAPPAVDGPERPSQPQPRPRARAAVAEPATVEAPAAPASVPAAQGVTVTLPVPADAAACAEQLKGRVGGDIDPARAADAVVRSRTMRERALAQASGSDVSAVTTVAAEIRREREFLADKARGGTMQMLRDLTSGTRLFDLVGNADAFGAHFVRRERGSLVDGTTWKPVDGLLPGATLRFPAGAHKWDDSFRSAKEFPRDVVVEGAGMDATLIRLNELSADADVTNLTFRDCTIDCGDDYMTQLRSEHPITLRLERCRVVAFDMGAGGSVMLDARKAAFYASDCRFEAGYGRTDPGFGNLFSVDSVLARCERCTFVGPFSSVFDSGSSATYVFSDCAFERMEAGFAETLKAPPEGVRFERCTVANPVERGARLEKRPLSTFNASWPSKTR